MKTIKKILENPYIGFALLIKDIIEIITSLNNIDIKIKPMDTNVFINIIVDLFIAVVIYNLLKQYKSKADKNETNNVLQNHALQINFLKCIIASNGIRECDFDIAKTELNFSEMEEIGFKRDEKNKQQLNISELKPTIQKL